MNQMEENNINNTTESQPKINAGKNSPQVIATAIIVAGVIIAGAILLKGSENRPPLVNNNDQEIKEIQIKPVASDEHILGNPNAKITIIEYSDLECPFCKSFHDAMHRVVNDKGGQVAWVYRHYPIPQLHPRAFFQAEATECAWEQGGNEAFWKYTNRIFEVTPSNNGLADAELPIIAEYVGLDVETFNNCLASGKFKDKVQADTNDGVRAGVQGTPSSFILVGGKVVDTIPGALPYEAIMQQLSQIK